MRSGVGRESQIYIVLKQEREQRRLFVITTPTNEFQLQLYFDSVEDELQDKSVGPVEPFHTRRIEINVCCVGMMSKRRLRAVTSLMCN